MSDSTQSIAQPQPEEILRTMLKAQENEDFEGFIAPCTEGIKTSFKKSVFFAVCEKVSAHLAAGYELQFLTRLDQRQRQLYVWKLTFTDGAGELLLRFWLTPENEVVGIMLDGANSLREEEENPSDEDE